MITEIRPADGHDIALYKNLFNMYQNEFSVYQTDGKFSYVDENGYFDADTVNEIFPPDDAILPFVITGNGRNIGLLLITKAPYAERDYCVEEMYLVRAARGTGAAQAALRQFFAGHPGVYTLDVFNENRRAYAFWKRLIAEEGVLLDERPTNGSMALLTFRV